MTVDKAEIELEELLPTVEKDDGSDMLFDGSVETTAEKHGRNGTQRPLRKSPRNILLVATMLLVVVLATVLFVFETREQLLKPLPLSTTASTPTATPTMTLNEMQIENFRNQGPGLILNIHITHHAGTTLCGTLGRAVGAPGKFCNLPSDTDLNVPENYPRHHPWTSEETSQNVALAREAYRLIAWELGKVPSMSLNETKWEDPNLVSILVVREPISRALAGSGHTAKNWPFVRTMSHTDPNKNFTEVPDTGSLEQWWSYAKDPFYDNFALRRLVGPPNDPNDKESNNIMTQEHLHFAKSLVSRFTFVLDQACLNENLNALQETLNITTSIRRKADLEETAMHPQKYQDRMDGGDVSTVPGLHPPPRQLMANPYHLSNAERIPFRDVYEYMLEKFQYDIELYQWAKRRSLVQCLDRGDS